MACLEAPARRATSNPGLAYKRVAPIWRRKELADESRGADGNHRPSSADNSQALIAELRATVALLLSRHSHSSATIMARPGLAS
jgi:hypothetical protein